MARQSVSTLAKRPCEGILNGPPKCKHLGEKHGCEPVPGRSLENSVTAPPDGLELPPNVLVMKWRRTHIQNSFHRVVSKHRCTGDPVPPRP
jgi:hypothetical protein